MTDLRKRLTEAFLGTDHVGAMKVAYHDEVPVMEIGATQAATSA